MKGNLNKKGNLSKDNRKKDKDKGVIKIKVSLS